MAAFIDRAGADGAETTAMADLVQMRLAAAAEVAIQGAGVAEAFGDVLTQEPGEQTNRMAMAVVFNAVLFHFHVSEHHPHIPSPSLMMAENDFHQLRILEVWDEILAVDYWPIFGVSRKLVWSIAGARHAAEALRILCRTAAAILETPDASGFVGRLFGELIGDRKFLATFYTQPASAALLAELAVGRLEADWSDVEAIGGLRVGDMACGTGALLTAAYRRIMERHRVEGGDDAAAHRALIENVMIGCDIMPAAVHLTAARLSGERPDVDYTGTKTWVMPYGEVSDAMGVSAYRIGALDLLHSNTRAALWGDGTMAATAQGDEVMAVADVPAESLDIVIMNPPFTRPTNHEGHHADVPNPAFAGLGNDSKAQKVMSDALAANTKGIRGTKASHGNAGIASNFIDLAHAKLKPGGVLALVLPASVVSGAAWGGARELLTKRYMDIVAVSISDQGDGGSEGRAFSADTGMAEVIFVATKKEEPATSTELEIAYAILNGIPISPIAGVEVARAVNAKLGSSGLLAVGEEDMGLIANSMFGAEMKGQPIGVSNVGVMVSATELAAGRLTLPHSPVIEIPITTLGHLGCRGWVDRDISGHMPNGFPRGPFDIFKLPNRADFAQASWPVLWSHNHRAETAMRVLPCSQGVERHELREFALVVWEGRSNLGKLSIAGATRLHLNRDFQVNSQPMAACMTPCLAIGGRAWPSFHPTPDDKFDVEIWEKALCVWLNSTLGLVGRWWMSNRQQKGRANLTVTTMGNIPVLNLKEIPDEQVQELAMVFDEFERSPMLPANESYRDETRQQLDERVLCGVLGLPESIREPLGTLRLQWCAEPSVHGNKKTRP
ncbi:hypothetical protein [Candidatus Poriferisocius sp.]|uniref:hypothetical protein n=1 Tax=Candidatus Poriferisocius sp. TaxID=3101276 RepID=UPI003B014639